MKRTWLLASVAGLLVLAATFWAGRASKGVQVKTVDRVQTRTEYRDRVVEKVVHDVQVQKDVQTRTVTVTKWAKAPDGTPVVTQETHQERSSEAKTTAKVQATRDATTQAQQSVVTLHEAAPALPSWSVSLMPGYQFHGDPAVSLKGPLVVGASVEKRIAGPLYLGAWVSTTGAAGITLRGEL